mgnify:CR=1 FL=1
MKREVLRLEFKATWDDDSGGPGEYESTLTIG